jgi:hypothetical protein
MVSSGGLSLWVWLRSHGMQLRSWLPEHYRWDNPPPVLFRVLFCGMSHPFTEWLRICFRHCALCLGNCFNGNLQRYDRLYRHTFSDHLPRFCEHGSVLECFHGLRASGYLCFDSRRRRRRGDSDTSLWHFQLCCQYLAFLVISSCVWLY